MKGQKTRFRRWRAGAIAFWIGLLLWMGLHGAGAIAQNAPAMVDPQIQQGLSLYQSGNFDAAARAWAQAAQQARQERSPIAEALALNYLALAYQELGQTDTAQASLDRGLKLVASSAGDSRAALARLLNTQGSLQLARGKPEAALASWQSAAKAYRQLDDRAGEAGSLINQAQAEQTLGYFLRARNTLSLAEQLVVRQADLDLRLTLALNLGQMLTNIGEFDRANAVLTSAQAIAQQNNIGQQAAALSIQKGNLAYLQRAFSPALEAYQQALLQSDRPETQLDANLNRLRVLIAQHQWPAAQTLAAALAPALDRQPASRRNLVQRLQLADSQLDLYLAAQTPSALEIARGLQQAIQQSAQLRDLRLESFAVGYLGRLYESKRQWQAAETTTLRAFDLAKQARSDESCYRWKWQLGRILRAQGKTKPALAFYRESVDILQGLRQNLVAIGSDLQYSFRDRVEPVYREYVDLLLQSRGGRPPALESLKLAQQAIESLRLAELSYFLRSSCLEDRRRPLTHQIRPGTALLYPIVLEDRIATLLSLPDGSLHLTSHAVAAAKVETLVEELRVALEKPYTAPEGKTLGLELYRWLVEPAEALLAQQQIKTLVFVPDGVLRNIPLTTLYDGKRFTIERYAVAIAPSLQLVTPDLNPTGPSRSIVAGLSDSRAGFAPLAFVPSELKAIVQTLPGNVLLNQQFTSQAIANAVDESEATVLHFATHGQFSSNVDETFILAWDKPITLHELKDLIEKRQQPFRKAIDLLVLSACETAAGDKRAALGLAGVAVQAGARSTVATLWTVDDESSSLFMKYFYDALSQPGTTKAEALRQAQLRLLEDPDYRHPFHWAAYVLVGNWI
ncbi:CHAT domain-containing protein [Altericista sp. CCNU0014]|uniref:CHAT domain-containing protein n=1 Tax=Altericista sp. CCNU0014 TaxID=3082949 RepID=UPI00384F7D46